MIQYGIMSAGIILLFISGEMMLRGAVSLGKHLGLSRMLSGLVIVGLATSLPELVLTSKAIMAERSDLGLGAVIGSNIANMLLILGVASMIAPVMCSRKMAWRDAMAVMIGYIALLGFTYIGPLHIPFALTALFILILYYTTTWWLEHGSNAPSAAMHRHESDELQDVKITLPVSVLLVGAATVLMMLSATIVLDGVMAIADEWGISDAVAGTTILAIAVSLPELATTIIASIRRHNDVVLGNVLGACIFNTLGVLGGVSLFTSLEVPFMLSYFDMYVMLASAIVVLILIFCNKPITRPIGGLLLLAYIVYVQSLYSEGVLTS